MLPVRGAGIFIEVSRPIWPVFSALAAKGQPNHHGPAPFVAKPQQPNCFLLCNVPSFLVATTPCYLLVHLWCLPGILLISLLLLSFINVSSCSSIVLL